MTTTTQTSEVKKTYDCKHDVKQDTHVKLLVIPAKRTIRFDEAQIKQNKTT